MSVKLFIEPTILSGFIFYSAVVLIKMMMMSFATGLTRVRKGIFANKEDVPPGSNTAKVKYDDVDVERLRRCHLNDLENVYLFVLAGLFYCLTGPSTGAAMWHFRLFAVSRILHTVAYIFQAPQPTRAIFFFIGVVVCASMLVQTALTTF